jgi:hypothetical protein
LQPFRIDVSLVAFGSRIIMPGGQGLCRACFSA